MINFFDSRGRAAGIVADLTIAVIRDYRHIVPQANQAMLVTDQPTVDIATSYREAQVR